jgi:hypothetical protein
LAASPDVPTVTLTVAPSPTLTPSPSPTRQPTATPTRTPTATPTRSPTATPLPIETPFGAVKPLDPGALPNFTLTFSFDVVGLAGTSDTRLQLTIEQHAPDNYHLRLVSETTSVESWLVGGTNYFLQNDTIVEVPPGSGTEVFSPSVFLQSVPRIDPTLEAARVGDEMIGDRLTIHYRVNSADVPLLFVPSGSPAPEFSSASGAFDAWIDVELQIMLKAFSDATWTNADGSSGRLHYDYTVTNIGTTPEVGKPV